MRYKLLACKILTREIASILWRCPHTIDLTMMSLRLHERPENLHKALQAEIDLIDANEDDHTNELEKHGLDAILLGYGLCSNATLGLRSKKYPLVIPRIHDCISLMFGSRERYAEYAKTYPGTFYFTQSWCDIMPSPAPEQMEQKRAELMEKYDDDEETVEYLMSLEDFYFKDYDRLLYVNWPELPHGEEEENAHQLAEEKGWQYTYLEGKNSLLEDFLFGRWDEEHFLVVPPGQTIAASYDENVLEKG